MADNWDHAPRDGPRRQQSPSRKSSLPGQNEHVKCDSSTTHHGSIGTKNAHRRISSVVNLTDYASMPDDSIDRKSATVDKPDWPISESNTVAQDGVESDMRFYKTIPRKVVRPHLLPPSRPTDMTASVAKANELRSSSGNGPAVKQPASSKWSSTGKTAKQRRSSAHRPDALSFLDLDSPLVTAESIEASMQEASSRSPTPTQSTSPSNRSTSSASSGFRDDASDTMGGHETDRSTSPEHSVDGDHDGRMPGSINSRIDPAKTRKRSFGTPYMPRGNAQHPHISPNALTPRAPVQNHAKHLPRAEKLPLTGYELLASRLSATSLDRPGPFLRPMYRRFETLNHRILLHLQDEICELEEQLHRLDTADTQNRRLQNSILPASRRAEYLSGGELQWHKTDVLGKIGFKLEQYNHVLASFKGAQSLPTPTLADIHEYRGYLATDAPIAEAESHFLDATDDLVCVDDEDQDDAVDEDMVATPMPDLDCNTSSPERRASTKPQPDISQQQAKSSTESDGSSAYLERPAIPISLAVSVAVMLPVLTFPVVPSYLGRMTVVFLVGFGILSALIQGKIVSSHATRDFCICAGYYGAAMAVLAGTMPC